MVTYALVLVSAIAGLLMIGAGLWGGARLMSDWRSCSLRERLLEDYEMAWSGDNYRRSVRPVIKN